MGDVIKLYFKTALNYLWAFARWLMLGLAVGVVSGVIGAYFSKAITFVTELRGQNPWLILLLPAAGLLSVGLYKLCRVSGIGTNDVFKSVRNESKVPYLLAPAIFIGTCLTHMFGGSAGREGAALQLGGSVSSLLGGILHLNDKTKHILTMCGMGAFFSALFGTPLGACIFALEVVSVGHICSAAFFPAIISSISAYIVSIILGAHPERFALTVNADLGFEVLWKVLVVAIAGAIVSFIFCRIMHFSEHIFKTFFKNEFLRIAVGGVLIVGLTYLIGNQNYNGGGIEIIEGVFEGNKVGFEVFLLKILFTAITIGVGFKGGEIVPTLFVGATMGAFVGGLVGLNVGLSAAVGIASLFCGVTNCPIATIVLCIELFDGEGLILCALACVTSFLLSGNGSLYTGQRLIYSKLDDEEINVDAG